MRPTAPQLVAAERRPIGDRRAEPHAGGIVAGSQLSLRAQHPLPGEAHRHRRQREQQLPDGTCVVLGAYVLRHVADDPAHGNLPLIGS